MSVFNAFFIYLLIWWVMLFTVLPFGIERNEDDGQGFDAGAPRIANLKKKLIINTILSGVILLIIIILVDMGVIRWTEWFENAWQ